MNARVAAAAALALIGACLVSTPARANTELEFCNKTGSKVFIAIVFLSQQTQKWTLASWHAAAAGGCAKIGTVRTGLFYYYAEKEGRKLHWPAEANVDKAFCVPDKGSNHVLTAAACTAGERSLGFRGLVPNAGKYSFALN